MDFEPFAAKMRNFLEASCRLSTPTNTVHATKDGSFGLHLFGHLFIYNFSPKTELTLRDPSSLRTSLMQDPTHCKCVFPCVAYLYFVEHDNFVVKVVCEKMSELPGWCGKA